MTGQRLAFFIMFVCCVCPLQAETDSTAQRSKLPPLPVAAGQKEQPGIAGPFVGVHNDALIIAGGANFPGKPVWENGTKVYHDDVFVLTKDESGDFQWHKGFKLSSPLAYGVAISTGRGVVCVGGRDNKQARADAFIMRWHPTKRSISFKPLPSLPSAISNMDGAIIDETIYIAGGVVNGAESNQLLSLDLSGGSVWKRLPDFPGPPRKQLVAAAQHTEGGKQLFIFSGLSYRDDDDEPFVSTDGHRYDPATAKWTGIVPIRPEGSDPIAVCGGTAIECGRHHILVFGGRGLQNLAWILKIMRARQQAKELQNNREFQRLVRIIYGYFTETEFHFNNKVLAYNTLTDEWTVLGRHPFVPVTNTRAVFWDGGIVLASGEQQPGVRTSQIFRARVPEQFAGNSELTIVAFGDSTTALRNNVRQVYSQRLPALLAARGIRANVINSGVGGSHSERLAENAHHRRRHALDRFDEAVRAHKPDVVIIQYGINDSYVDEGGPQGKSRISLEKYSANLAFMVETLKGDGSMVILMTPNAFGSNKEAWRHERLAQYAAGMRRVASKLDVPLIDIYKRFEQYGDGTPQSRDALLLDGVHPNGKGHAIVAEQIAELIRLLVALGKLDVMCGTFQDL